MLTGKKELNLKEKPKLKRRNNHEKKLIVTAKYGSLEFEEVAYPYNPNAHQEQLDSCISSIHQKMKEAGKYEMKDSFEYSEKIEEKPEH